MNWVSISQKTAFFIVSAVNVSNPTQNTSVSVLETLRRLPDSIWCALLYDVLSVIVVGSLWDPTEYASRFLYQRTEQTDSAAFSATDRPSPASEF
jgi:hypothetical protein